MIATPAMAESLRIVTLNLPPYGYIEKGVDKGLCYEMANALAQEAGFEPDNKIVPLARGIADIAEGRADIIIMFPNPKIEANANNLGLILSMETVIIGKAGGLRTLRDIRGKTVATIRGALYDDRVSKKNGVVLYPTASYSQSLKMLLSGRVDAVIGPKLGLYYVARKMKIPKQALDNPLVLASARGCVFVSRFTPHPIVERVTEALERMQQNGQIEKIVKEYSL